ncbi:MAG: patatin-like phospholipase family protein, partial [Longimicrobiales bacterium]
MATTLRVGFAMGGGVSLGTFNGAALTQALKLLLLRGMDRNHHPYERVLVDLFSGASAGSMSLAIMLRGLVHPAPDRMAVARHRLTTEFGQEFTALTPDAQETLLAAQVVQDIQEEIWVREITLKKLLGQGDQEAKGRVHLTAGLVDRGTVEELARRYLSYPGPGVGLSHRKILADRVLFASSLANLSPILADARSEFPRDEAGLLGLSDGLTSSVHRELRVFDLHFKDLFSDGGIELDKLTDPDTFPRRWCRYHSGEKVSDTDNTGRGIGSLLEKRAWARMAATSIASGAFPGAFEPVPLERRSYEYGETEDGKVSLWPAKLKGRNRHVFTYVDGGTFNNEPVREAFRLASFMDAQAPEEDFERLIVFVDPHVVVPDPSLRVPHHGAWMLDEPNRLLGSMDGLDLKRKASLDRLLPAGFSVVGAVLNESRVIEADKIFRTRKRFSLRNEIREHLHRSLSTNPDVPALKPLITRLSLLLSQDRAGVMIPAGAL